MQRIGSGLPISGSGPPVHYVDLPAGISRDQQRRLIDTISTLNYLFLGGPEPPAPGPNEPGPDPTTDDLGDCVDRGCE